MANGNYSVLKDNIDDYIKQNGDGDITGQVLQTQLFAMITSLGAGYQFMGVAKLTPTPTDPGSPDQNVFYVAFQPGIYSNFGSQTVADGEIAILKWNGSWTKEVTGAATAAQVAELGQEVIYDVSARNGGATYATLLDALNATPNSLKKGGMTIKYIDSASGQYKVFFLDSSTFKTNIRYWTGHILYDWSIYDSVNKFLVELYVPASVVTDYGTIKLYAISPQYPRIILANADASKTMLLTPSGSNSLLANANGAKAIVDWQYFPNEWFVGCVLNLTHISDLNFSPILKQVNDTQPIDGSIKAVESNYFYDRRHIEKITDNDVVNDIIKELWVDPAFLSSQSWANLYVYSIRKYNHSVILADSTNAAKSYGFSVDPRFGDNSILIGANAGVIIVDWDRMSGSSYNTPEKVITTKATNKTIWPTIFALDAIYSIAQMNNNTASKFGAFLKSVGTTPMVTWVDDDGVYTGIEKIRSVFESLSIPMTFAVIPPLTNIVHDSVTAEEYFEELQRDGHHITAHPNHDGWYNGDGNTYDITKVEPSLIDALVALKTPFIHSDMLVYPGSSDSYTAVRDIVRKWCACAITAGYNAPNHLGENTKWRIRRCFVDFTAHNLDWYKDLVDDCYTGGDWLIFGTHSNEFTNSEDTSNPSANTIGNLRALMTYVSNKPIQFYTLWDAYNRRKALFDFYEYNN